MTDKYPSLVRIPTPIRDAKPSRIIAYDLETTRIPETETLRGVDPDTLQLRSVTPKPLFITAYSEDPCLSLALAIESIEHLFSILVEHFLIDAHRGCKFVAWNANHFDAYFIAVALLQSDRYIIRPYLTRNKALRGMRVFLKGEENLNTKASKVNDWQFLDGIAMTGMQGVSLEKFTKLFSPDHQKLKGAIDWEREEFDATNPSHVEYARIDSESLWYSMRAAEDIMIAYFNRTFAATMGNVCIKILCSNIPEVTIVHHPGDNAIQVLREYVMRGGFCFCVRRYSGPIWKYDLNQAYAAAMRDAKLPSGSCYWSTTIHPAADVYIAKIRARNPKNRIPFYAKCQMGGKILAVFATQQIEETWLTSIEIDQLYEEGWSIEVLECYFWDDSFSLREYVDKLENARRTAPGGPKGAAGTMLKAVGNHSYGKTIEALEAMELLIAKECPDGFSEYMPEADGKLFAHIWSAKKEQTPRAYHKPQIGAFITAHVRMVVRRAALLCPEGWLYADTDCVAFSEPVSLNISETKYGEWKEEEKGTLYRIVAKKVYARICQTSETLCDLAKFESHAKGMSTKRLTESDFANWIEGKIPIQKQPQRQNFLKVLQGSSMFIERLRKGTKV